MKHRISIALAALLFNPIQPALAAGDGEWWEISTQMEMEGMPAMPAGQAVKFCRPKGDESKPVNSGDDKNCAITDLKQSGNTVRFKMACTGKDAMTGSGEITSTANSFKQNIKMRAGGDGMVMVSTGKRIGGACKAAAGR